jgi:hypothetical protein
VSGMERPPIILLYKIPSLRSNRIAIHILNRPTNILGMIQKHFPPMSTPYPLVRILQLAVAQFQERCVLQIRNHFLRFIAMFPNHQVNVIHHDRACINCVLAVFDYASKRISNLCNFLCAKGPHGTIKTLLRFDVKGIDLSMCWLNPLAPKMNLTEGFQDILANDLRRAPAQIIWEPIPIDRPDQVICENVGSHNADLTRWSAKPQAAILLRNCDLSRPYKFNPTCETRLVRVLSPFEFRGEISLWPSATPSKKE